MISAIKMAHIMYVPKICLCAVVCSFVINGDILVGFLESPDVLYFCGSLLSIKYRT